MSSRDGRGRPPGRKTFRQTAPHPDTRASRRTPRATRAVPEGKSPWRPDQRVRPTVRAGARVRRPTSRHRNYSLPPVCVPVTVITTPSKARGDNVLSENKDPVTVGTVSRIDYSLCPLSVLPAAGRTTSRHSGNLVVISGETMVERSS